MDWTVEEITKRLEDISASVNDIFNAPVAINPRLSTTLGRVKLIHNNGIYEPLRIEFSKKFLETATDECVQGTIEHEWAHYYATKTTGEHHGHDALFKEICSRIGCTHDKARTKVERLAEAPSQDKYIIYCPSCDRVVGRRQRKCTLVNHLEQYHCSICGCEHLELRTGD